MAALQKRMVGETDKLAQIDRANSAYRAARAALETSLGADPAATQALRVEEVAKRTASVEKLRAARTALDQHLASESSLVTVFGFLTTVKEKRAARARLAIGDLVPGLETAKRVSEIEDRIRSDLRAGDEALRSAELSLAAATALRLDFQAAERGWVKAKELLGGADDVAELERHADLDVRFSLFLLATHYWEGRWLLAMEADLAGIVASKGKNGKATVIPAGTAA